MPPFDRFFRGMSNRAVDEELRIAPAEPQNFLVQTAFIRFFPYNRTNRSQILHDRWGKLTEINSPRINDLTFTSHPSRSNDLQYYGQRICRLLRSAGSQP